MIDCPSTTVAGANDVSRLRRGVAAKTARAKKTLKRDHAEGRLPSDQAGLAGKR
jgi:hypothetical protein